MGQDDVLGLAAEMAYRFLFALFPFLIFLAAFVGFVGARVGADDLFERVMRLLALFFPPEVHRVLEDWVRGVVLTESPGLLTAGAAGALWGAGGGVGTLIKGLNRAYGLPESRPIWVLHGLTLLMTVALSALMLGGVVLYAIGGQLTAWGAGQLGLDLRTWVWWNVLRGPGVAIGLALVLLVAYSVLPGQRQPLRHTWPGALFATAAWLLLTMGFSLYVSKLGTFDRTFGSLGAAALLMLWMYVVGAVLLIGGEINALIFGDERQTGSEAVESAR